MNESEIPDILYNDMSIKKVININYDLMCRFTDQNQQPIITWTHSLHP